jgi:hypothetical protein
VSDRKVDPRFIERWAQRYMDIWKKRGEASARAWISSFVDKEDRINVILAIQKKQGKKE